MNYLQKARETARRLVKSYFVDDYGKPYEMTDGQCDIFLPIFTKKYPRVQILGATQYGKSDSISMGVIMRSLFFKEQFAIIAPGKEKAQIIMSRVIQHAFDHPRFYKQLELDANMPMDRLRKERTKSSIIWKHGGGVKTFTANVTNKNAVFKSLSGFGSPNIIEDESGLIYDEMQAMVLRMLGGHAHNFLLKIGNPYHRNHFYKTWNSDKYHKVFIDYHQAVAEGRYTQEFVEEMRGEPFFDILYECKFPAASEFSLDGHRKLITHELLNEAFISEEEAVDLMKGDPKLGCDFAGAGRDRNAYIARWPKVMKLLSTNEIKDTMQQVPIVENYGNEFGIDETDIAIDYGGLGQGIGDRLHEKDYFVNNINFGSSAPEGEKDKYKNMRAYMFYQLKMWIEGGGKIVKDDGFLELLYVNYKEDSSGKFQIQSKKDMKKEMKKQNMAAFSPDIADAAALTFADNSELLTEDDFDII